MPIKKVNHTQTSLGFFNMLYMLDSGFLVKNLAHNS
uniref:Uncharacterized protein n=1 Tax=Rhizophora mucronata TaxID=61149 RepID=A0A2P2MYA5_RHIMU